MKNPTADELAALRTRAQRLAPPPLPRGADGRLTDAGRAAFARRAEAILRRNRAVGAAIVLRAPGGAQDVFTYGHARLSPRVPVTPETCFRVASVSKLVMAFGALALCERGMLALDADVSETVGYPVRNPRYPDAPVTLRMLLTHTASVMDEGNYGTRGMQPGCTLRELLQNPANWLPQRPGESFHYSNLGAGAAGSAMEYAAGEPLDDVMQRLVFAPLGIRASYDPRRIGEDLADGYGVRGLLPPRLKYDARALAARPPEPFDPERDYLCAAGRLITNSAGMGALLALLADHGSLGVLSGASLDEMRALQDGRGGVMRAGRGLNVAHLPGVFPGVSPVGHQGVAYGMCAELFCSPDTGAGVGVMTSGVRLARSTPPLMRAGFVLALGFASFS